MESRSRERLAHLPSPDQPEDARNNHDVEKRSEALHLDAHATALLHAPRILNRQSRGSDKSHNEQIQRAALRMAAPHYHDGWNNVSRVCKEAVQLNALEGKAVFFVLGLMHVNELPNAHEEVEPRESGHEPDVGECPAIGPARVPSGRRRVSLGDA